MIWQGLPAVLSAGRAGPWRASLVRLTQAPAGRPFARAFSSDAMADQDTEFHATVHPSDLTASSLNWLDSQEPPIRHITDMTLYVLGSGSKAPTNHRGLASYAVVYRDFHGLVDAGEGTQVRMALARLSVSSFTRIFITHLHGDHIFGLPGVILNALDGISKEDLPLQIYGPPGLRLWLEHTLKISAAGTKDQYVVNEMHSSPAPKRHQHDIYPDKDGTWNLCRSEDIAVLAREIEHTSKCWGFVFKEEAPRGRFNIQKATALGIPEGPMRGILSKGGEVVSPATGKTVTQADVCDPHKPARKIVVLGDTCNASSMIPLGESADILVHECTLANKDQRKARPRGHSTPRIAAALARTMNVKNLVLSHYSQRFFSSEMVEHELGVPVRQLLTGTSTNVITGGDLMRVVLHRRPRDDEQPVVEPDDTDTT